MPAVKRVALPLIAVLSVAAPQLASAAPQRPNCHGLGMTEKRSARIQGTAGDDVLLGLTRRGSRVDGRRGDDHVCGGRRRDRLFGRAGADRISARRGNDVVAGGVGRDRIGGGGGRDLLRGGHGADRLDGGRGRDRMRGGRGPDRLLARDGVRDVVNCGPGRDLADVDRFDFVRGCETVRLGSPTFALPTWSDGTFFEAKNYLTIEAGDVDGDGREELLALGAAGIELWRFERAYGEWVQVPAQHPPLTETVWAAAPYYSTIQAGDVNRDGRAELLARAPEGLRTWAFDPGSQAWSELETTNHPFPDAEGWNAPSAYETLANGSLTPGDDNGGLGIVYGRNGEGFRNYLLDGDTWKEVFATEGLGMTDAAGWNQPAYYKTLRLADLDGDGRRELIARGADGLHAWSLLEQGRETIAGGPFADAGGWDRPSSYETFAAADVDADGRDEVIGRGAAGMQVYSPAEGKMLATTGPFSDAEGFTAAPYFQTITTARLLRDGPAEIVGRSAAGLRSYSFAGGAWTATAPINGDFADARDWNRPRYYRTIRAVETSPTGPETIVARGATGIVSLRLPAGQSESWQTTGLGFPQFSGEAAAAYTAFNEALGGGNRNFDLRRAFAATENRPDYAQLQAWGNRVESLERAAKVGAAAWDEVRTELLFELDNAAQVAYWFEVYLPGVLSEVFTAEAMDPTAERIKFDVESNIELAFAEWEAITGTVTGLLGAGAASDALSTGSVVLSSIAGLAAANGLGAPGVDAALAGINAEYREIRSRLQGNFTAALDGLVAQEEEIVGDYALQSAVGQMIQSDTWGTVSAAQRATSIAQAQRNYAVSVWQTLVPGIWSAYAVDPENAWLCEERGEGKRPNVCDWESAGGFRWRLDVNATNSQCGGFAKQPCNAPPAALRQTLFGATQPGCVAPAQAGELPSWRPEACNLGLPPQTVFEGWGIVTYVCTGEFDAYRCRRR